MKTKKKIFKTAPTKKKTSANLPTKLSKNQQTEGYYQCLCQASQKGFKGNITEATKLCKTNAPAILKKRNDEISKIMKSYQQIGVSLGKLLHH